MKRLMASAICIILIGTANAQHVHTVAVYHSPVYVYRPSLGFGVGYFAPFYPYGYTGPYPGYYPYAMQKNSSKLQRKEEEIRSDYADRIYSVHQDNTLTAREKRQTIRNLKKQRKQEIHDLVSNYHKQPADSGN